MTCPKDIVPSCASSEVVINSLTSAALLSELSNPVGSEAILELIASMFTILGVERPEMAHRAHLPQRLSASFVARKAPPEEAAEESPALFPSCILREALSLDTEMTLNGRWYEYAAPLPTLRETLLQHYRGSLTLLRDLQTSMWRNVSRTAGLWTGSTRNAGTALTPGVRAAVAMGAKKMVLRGDGRSPRRAAVCGTTALGRLPPGLYASLECLGSAWEEFEAEWAKQRMLAEANARNGILRVARAARAVRVARSPMLPETQRHAREGIVDRSIGEFLAAVEELVAKVWPTQLGLRASRPDYLCSLVKTAEEAVAAGVSGTQGRLAKDVVDPFWGLLEALAPLADRNGESHCLLSQDVNLEPHSELTALLRSLDAALRAASRSLYSHEV